MTIFIVVDQDTLDEALTVAGKRDKIVIAEGAFAQPPKLVLVGDKWTVEKPAAGMSVTGWDMCVTRLATSRKTHHRLSFPKTRYHP